MIATMNASLEALSLDFASFKAASLRLENKEETPGHSTSSSPKNVPRLTPNPEPERLRIVSFYMDGSALCWF